MTKRIVAFVGVAFLGCSTGDGTDETLARARDNLYLRGNPWPDKTVNVCWTEESREREDFDEFSDWTQASAMRGWTQATGLRITDWGECPENTNGVVVAQMQSSGQSSCGIGYNANGQVNLQISPGGATIMHEMGHCIGFAHEFARPDFTDDPSGGCRGSNVSGDSLGTPANDRTSIMVGMGYCSHVQRTGYWDEIGSQKVYGFPNMFADVTGDGKDDAFVVRSDHAYVRQANSASTGFGAGGDWTGNSYFYGDKGTFLADVSGDGKADLILVNDTRIWVRKSNGSSFDSPLSWTGSGTWGTLETHFADVTGDCKADAILVNGDDPATPSVDESNTYVRQANSASTGFGAGGVFGPARVGRIDRTIFANVSHTGVGRGCWADAIYFDTDGAWVATSNGSSFGTASNWSNGVPLRGTRATFVVDVDGDGLADVVEVNTNDVVVHRSTGTAFDDPETFSTVGRWDDRGVFPGDFNGDGLWDLAMIGDDRIRVSKSNGSAFPSYSFWTGTPYFGDQLMF